MLFRPWLFANQRKNRSISRREKRSLNLRFVLCIRFQGLARCLGGLFKFKKSLVLSSNLSDGSIKIRSNRLGGLAPRFVQVGLNLENNAFQRNFQHLAIGGWGRKE